MALYFTILCKFFLLLETNAAMCYPFSFTKMMDYQIKKIKYMYIFR